MTQSQVDEAYKAYLATLQARRQASLEHAKSEGQLAFSERECRQAWQNYKRHVKAYEATET